MKWIQSPKQVNRRPWFRYALQVRGSVIPSVLPRVIVCGLFGVLISGLFQIGYPVNLPVLASIIPNIVLGLLLVFRTNTAYERYWEGRKLWGMLINTSRNLARQIWVAVQETDANDRQRKRDALYLVVAFAIAMKLHLRNEPIGDELHHVLPRSRVFQLKAMNNPPLEVAFWLSDFLQQQQHETKLDPYQLSRMQDLVNLLVDTLGGCERILKTPIPMAYAIHLKQLLLLYCLSLPFQLVEQLIWWTGPVVVLISFTLFGIEEIGIEIENPFGHDFNDLPLDTICLTMQRNLEDLMSLEPSSAQSSQWLPSEATNVSPQ